LPDEARLLQMAEEQLRERLRIMMAPEEETPDNAAEDAARAGIQIEVQAENTERERASLSQASEDNEREPAASANRTEEDNGNKWYSP
jgi:hypothetical protein